MDPTIVFDLDYTMYDPGNHELHPEAHLILKRARRDFGRILLWTFGWDQVRACHLVSELGISKNFDELIGSDHEFTKQSRMRSEAWGCKDLSLLAPENRIVMIENDDFCVPKNRQVRVPNFYSTYEHDLRIPYAQAYLLMYHADEFNAMTEEQKLAAAREIERGYAIFRDKEL